MLNMHETQDLNKKLVTNQFADLPVTSQYFNPNNITKGTDMSLKINNSNGNKKLRAKFKLNQNNQEIFFTLKGQKAKTLKCLIESQAKGCTALEISKTFALRLSEYVRALRNDNLAGGFNLDIVMIKEMNPTNWHGRYILNSHVEIVEVFG